MLGYSSISQVPISALPYEAVAYVLIADPGSYSITGAAATFTVSYSMICAPGSYAITGAPATFTVAYLMDASSGSYSITGAAAEMTVTTGPGTATGKLRPWRFWYP